MDLPVPFTGALEESTNTWVYPAIDCLLKVSSVLRQSFHKLTYEVHVRHAKLMIAKIRNLCQRFMAEGRMKATLRFRVWGRVHNFGMQGSGFEA